MTEAEWLQPRDLARVLRFCDGKVSQRKLLLFGSACARRVWPLIPNEISRQGVELVERYVEGEVDLAAIKKWFDRQCIALDEYFNRSLFLRVKHWDLQCILFFHYFSDWRPATFREGAPQPGYISHRHAEQDADHAAMLAAVDRCRHVVEVAKVAPASTLCGEGEVSDPAAVERAFATERKVQYRLLRDIIGDPFRTVTVEPPWNETYRVHLPVSSFQIQNESFDLTWLTSDVVSIATAIYQDRAFDRMPILGDALEESGCTNADVLQHCRQPGQHVRGCWVVDALLRKE